MPNDLSNTKLVAIAGLLVLIVLLFNIAITGYNRLKAGRNGSTLAITFFMVAYAVLFLLIVLYIAYPIPEGAVTIGIIVAGCATAYLKTVLWVEGNQVSRRRMKAPSTKMDQKVWNNVNFDKVEKEVNHVRSRLKRARSVGDDRGNDRSQPDPLVQKLDNQD